MFAQQITGQSQATGGIKKRLSATEQKNSPRAGWLSVLESKNMPEASRPILHEAMTSNIPDRAGGH